MSNLKEICEVTWRAVFPEPRDKTAISLEEFISKGVSEYAAAMWIYRQQQIQTDGFFQMPSEMLTEKEFDVTNNTVDLTGIDYLSSLSSDLWLQNIGGLNCKCDYVKSTLNLMQILCDDDSLGDKKPYYIVGKKIKFPKGTHATKLTITYANTGAGLDPRVIEVNDYVASKVSEKLLALYGKRMPSDETNNNSVNQ